jgi:hypothetical protein
LRIKRFKKKRFGKGVSRNSSTARLATSGSGIGFETPYPETVYLKRLFLKRLI